MTHETTLAVHEIVAELERLHDEKISEVLDFVRFLRVQSESRLKYYAPRQLNEEHLAWLYAESAEEDKKLAEAGMSDYEVSSKHEDKNANG